MGSGFIVANDYTEMQIDPIGFLQRLSLAWVPNIYLGYHSGFMHAYATPYGWLSALLQFAHVPPAERQRALDFAVFAAIAAGAYWGIGCMAPATSRSARMCGALAYLLNPYVAFNVGNGTSNMLAPYAALPFLTGLSALALRGSMPPLTAGILAGVVTFCGGGINAPLVAMNAIVVVLYVAVAVVALPDKRAVLRRLSIYGAVGCAAAIVIDLYWLVPFLDYTHTFWLGGLLDESPKEHSAEASFANVLRGLGQWSIFRGDDAGPWYLWAAAYLTPFFAWILWFGPLLGALGLALRKRVTAASAFFTALAAVSVPLAVGYYRGAAGTAISEPVYDFLYTKVPLFAMFRSAYKWVWPYEFAVAGLVALAVAVIQARVRAAGGSWRVGRPAVAAAAAILLPVAFGPVVAGKMYHPNLPLPAWTRDEARFVGADRTHRLALFPGQYLEWYDWLDRSFQLEAQNVDRPLVDGYMTGAPSEESHVVLTRAYRLARSGDPEAASLMRAMSVDDVLQRDDYRSLMDFAFVGSWVPTDTSLAHDIVDRVLGAHPRARDGANRLYAIAGALPMVFGTTHARLDARPGIVLAASGRYDGAARGETLVSADGLSPAAVRETLRDGLVVSRDAGSLDDAAVTMAAGDASRFECFGARCTVTPKRGGTYRVFATVLSQYPSDFREAFDLPGYDFTHADGVAVPPAVTLDGRIMRADANGATWHDFGTARLTAGPRALRVDGASPTTPMLVALVAVDRWTRARSATQAATSGNRAVWFERAVDGPRAAISIPHDGSYVVAASPRRVISSASVRSPSIAAGRLVRDPAFGAARWARAGASVDLPYVPGAGVVSLAPRLMPAAWYLDASLYDWNRGSPTSWYVLAPRSVWRVIDPYPVAVSAHALLRLSGVNHAIRPFDVSVDGVRQAHFVIGGGSGTLPSDAGRAPLGTEAPSVRSVQLTLHPGVNEVVFESPAIATWSARDVDPTTVETLHVVAALAGDASFTIRATARDAAAAFIAPATRAIAEDALAVEFPGTGAARRTPWTALRIALDDATLAGIPSIAATVRTFPGDGIEWLAVAVADDPARSRVRFRIVKNVGVGGFFTLTPSAMLPNSASDASRRIVGAWIVLGETEDDAAKPNRTLFALHDLHVERALPAKLAETGVGTQPLAIDGRPIGAGSVFLRRGEHVVSARGPREGIGTLRVTSAGLPAAAGVALDVVRNSAVSLDVRTRGASPPFVLVLNESFHPEWQAEAGGVQLTHVRANGFANGWLAPASHGAQTIHVRFAAQRIYTATAWASIAGGIACLGGLLWQRRRR